MQAKRRRVLLWVVALALVLAAVVMIAWHPWNRGTGASPSGAGPQRAATPPPSALALALEERSRSAPLRVTSSWSGGSIAIVPDAPSFTIDRDYNQRAIVEVENRGADARRIVAELGRLEHGLLGSFVGRGSPGDPAELGASSRLSLDLYLFAQDAERRSYHTHIAVKDAASGDLLAVAPLSVFLKMPRFALRVLVGEADPATRGVPVTLVNEGATVTDLTVSPGAGLIGQVIMQPTMEHVNLSEGAAVKFAVLPRLSASFVGIEGEILLHGAGQDQVLPLRFELPEGQRVFVARSFSTTSDHAAGGFCTNNPNTSTSVGGSSSDSGSDSWHLYSDEDRKKTEDALGPRKIPGLPMDTDGRFKAGGKFGPVTIGFDAGAARGSDPTGPIVDSNLTIKAGPFGKTLHTEVSVSPEVQRNLDINAPQNPRGHILGGIDEGSVNYGEQGGSRNRPRGKRVRAAYLRDRADIEADNAAEAMLAAGPGTGAERLMVQVWHSDVWCGRGGRQIAFRVWDGYGIRALSRILLLSPDDQFAQWPAVVILPDARALVVWESCTERDAPPSLVYRVSGPGFGSWSPGRPVTAPAAGGHAGQYDPVAALGPDGHITLVWQQGDGDDATLRVSHSNDDGSFGSPVAPAGLPAGAARPVARVSSDGRLHLVFQARTDRSGSALGTPSTAVYYARSADGGATLELLHRVSPEGVDAGEPDLIVDDHAVHAVFRAGPDWNSRIGHASSGDGGATWGESKAITPEDQYAEFATLYLPSGGGAGIEFYANERSEAAQHGAVIKRFRSELREGAWSPPERLLTNFPELRSAWLQVNFRLRTSRAQYHKHDLSLLLNGFELLRMEDAIPEGTYLLPVHPGLVGMDGSGLPYNLIELRTRHMNPGMYSNAAEFRLVSRHDMLERFVAAGSQAEADARLGAESPTINHARPDVGLFATYESSGMPASPTLGESLTLILGVGNLGEGAAEEVRIGVHDARPPERGGAAVPIAEPIEVGHLAPMEFRRVTVRFPFGGKDQYFVAVQSSGDDFDSKNNVHTISFAVAPPPATPPRQSGADLLDLVDDPDPPFLCRVLEAASGREVQRLNRGKLAGPLPAGKYRLALTRHESEGLEVRFPQVFDLGPDRNLVTLRTAVELEVPATAGIVRRWDLVLAEHPETVVQWQFGHHPVMLVPPGEYRVLVRPKGGADLGILLDATIKVAADEHHVIPMGSGILLDCDDGADPLRGWAIVEGDRPERVVQNFEGPAAGQRMALVAPGNYRIVLSQRNGERIAWPETAVVHEGEFSLVEIPPSLFSSSDSLAGWKGVGPSRLARWTLSRDGKGVTNGPGDALPTYYVSEAQYDDVAMRCSVRVHQANPTIRGALGLVLGYRAPVDDEDRQVDFVLLKWSNELSVPARGGLYLVRVRGTLEGDDQSLRFLSPPVCEVLAHAGEEAWTSDRDHALEVRYRQRRIDVVLDGKSVLSAEGNFPGGRVGFCNLDYGDAVSFWGVTLDPLPEDAGPGRSIAGWGVAQDPSGDCAITGDKDRLAITVPGTNHNLNPEPGYENLLAPRTLQAVAGDFTLQGKVSAFARPEANTSATAQKHSYVAAGLLLWWNEKSFVRCFRAANGERGDLFIHVEAFLDGKRREYAVLAPSREIPDEPTILRVERRGDEFVFSWSADGSRWMPYARLTGTGLPANLEAGVAVVNATTREFSVQFDDLKLSTP